MCDTQVFFVYSWCSIHVVIFPSDHIPHGPQTPHPTWRQTHCSVTHSCTCQPQQEPPSPPALGFLFNTQGLAHTGQGIRGRNQIPVVVTQPPFQRRYSPGLVMEELCDVPHVGSTCSKSSSPAGTEFSLRSRERQEHLFPFLLSGECHRWLLWRTLRKSPFP